MNIQNKFSEIWSFLKYQWFEKRIDELNEQNKTCILNHYAYEDGIINTIVIIEEYHFQNY